MLAPGCRGLAQRLHTGMSSATPAGVTAPTAGAGWSPRGLAPVLKRDVVELGIHHARLQRRRAQLPLYAWLRSSPLRRSGARKGRRAGAPAETTALPWTSRLQQAPCAATHCSLGRIGAASSALADVPSFDGSATSVGRRAASGSCL